METWEPPKEFDDYVLVAPLGSGQMGKVYLAEDTMLARHVAIKFIAAIEPDAAARQRFLIEARAAARIQHPNVVTIYRVGEYAEKPYLITEFVRGKTLEAMARPIEWRRTLAIAIDLARGLAAAHRRGVLHRDIKLANVIVDEDGSAKLLDFGLATLVEEQSGAEGMVGTPDFMAPEIWRGEAATRCSDVYSLGAVLHELLAGEPPFADVPFAELGKAARERDALPVYRLARGSDPRLCAIIDRCLRRDASDRFPSGDELREALENLAHSADSAPVPAGNPYRGLRTFDEDHRALFFGRANEIGVVLDRLRTESFLVVTGDSGVGKSSLCRAGVVPSVRNGALGGGRKWTAVTVVPGTRPIAAIAAALEAAMGLEAGTAAAWLRSEPGEVGRRIASGLGPDRGLVVFLDQLEELLLISQPSEAQSVETALLALAEAGPGLRLLASLRADFLTRFAVLPVLGEELSRHLYFLRPLERERLRDVIVGPAEATGIRFASDALVAELADAAARAGGGLPLLQFALAELWEKRDRQAGIVTQAALDDMGGVGGALARHSDGVIRALPLAQRRAARHILTLLVSSASTRARRSESELDSHDPVTRAALDALVRGRLVVAYEGDDGSAFELAHEVLIASWQTLRQWLDEDRDGRATRERLHAAAAEWKRLGQARDALWSPRQLAELDLARIGALAGDEAVFVAESRRARFRRRARGIALAIAFPLLVVGIVAATRIARQVETDRRVAAVLAQAGARLDAAHRLEEAGDAARSAAFALFEVKQRDAGEAAWTLARADDATVDRAHAVASQELESAVALDPHRRDIRALLARALFDRAVLAERDGRLGQRDELVQRFALYDDGELDRRWTQAAAIEVVSDPPGANVVVESDDGPAGTARAHRAGKTPTKLSIPRGNATLVFMLPGREPVRDPVKVDRGEHLRVEVKLPPLTDIPPGFVYIPQGRAVFGSSGDDAARRGFFDTVPAHPTPTAAFLIGRHEVTFGDWLAWLDHLAPADRARHRPAVPSKVGASGALEVAGEPGSWRLHFQPGDVRYTARAGETLRYANRPDSQPLDWLTFPVMGVSAVDAEAYAAWLRATGTVPGARLCREDEWERAARGADDRDYPHGATLRPGDANFYETYGKMGMGPDVVGSHPASRSPFGIDDMAGNAFEWTLSVLDAGQYVVRGGSYFHDRKTAQIANRTVAIPGLRDATLGVRLCADAP